MSTVSLSCASLLPATPPPALTSQTRPIDVSEHWSSVLLEEWAKQASLEQELDLPVSVIASADAALQAKGQIGFIDLFTQPLFEAVSEILPGESLPPTPFPFLSSPPSVSPPPSRSPPSPHNGLRRSTSNPYTPLRPYQRRPTLQERAIAYHQSLHSRRPRPMLQSESGMDQQLTPESELHGYASSCAENRSLWQTRLDSFTSDPEQRSSVVQPPIEAASTDDRFRSLFPLLLPSSLLDLDIEGENDQGTISSVQSPLTPPPPPQLSSETLHFPTQHDDSSTKAMRAVYYTDLLEHKARGFMNSGTGVVPIPGVGGFEWDFDRRMSTPSGMLEGKQH